MDRPVEWQGDARRVHIAVGSVTLEGNLSVPEGAGGVVLFAHGSGSSRHSPRNRYVARLLNEAKLATLLIDLLTSAEEAIDLRTAHLRFDIGFLAERLLGATDWLTLHPDTRDLGIGYFGASTGAGAALLAAGGECVRDGPMPYRDERAAEARNTGQPSSARSAAYLALEPNIKAAGV